MTTKVMIIDGQAEFRSLLSHHVTTYWHDAVISEYDPLEAGHLPQEFSGAGNDIILLGGHQGDRDPLQTVRQFLRTPGFPPVIFLGSGEPEERDAARRLGVAGYLRRDNVSHAGLTILLGDIQQASGGVASTASLFVGDLRTGIRPLIKGYRFIRKLAASEYSAVYLAENESSGSQVVLKVLRQAPEDSDLIGAFDRFLQEYEIIAGLEHPNIVSIHDLGVGDEHAHIAMEFLDGGNLKSRVASGIDEDSAVSYLQQIGSALATIHSVGILHRDLKPGNIMFRADGSIALIDFGLAKRMRLEQAMTGSGEIFGTPYYMSPEQGHADDVDERGDIYSLGVIFYEMLTGEKPFRASNAMGIIYKHSNAPIPLLPHRLARYQVLINIMLAKKPGDRLQRAADIEDWL